MELQTLEFFRALTDSERWLVKFFANPSRLGKARCHRGGQMSEPRAEKGGRKALTNQRATRILVALSRNNIPLWSTQNLRPQVRALQISFYAILGKDVKTHVTILRLWAVQNAFKWRLSSHHRFYTLTIYPSFHWNLSTSMFVGISPLKTPQYLLKSGPCFCHCVSVQVLRARIMPLAMIFEYGVQAPGANELRAISMTICAPTARGHHLYDHRISYSVLLKK